MLRAASRPQSPVPGRAQSPVPKNPNEEALASFYRSFPSAKLMAAEAELDRLCSGMTNADLIGAINSCRDAVPEGKLEVGGQMIDIPQPTKQARKEVLRRTLATLVTYGAQGIAATTNFIATFRQKQQDAVSPGEEFHPSAEEPASATAKEEELQPAQVVVAQAPLPVRPLQVRETLPTSAAAANVPRVEATAVSPTRHMKRSQQGPPETASLPTAHVHREEASLAAINSQLAKFFIQQEQRGNEQEHLRRQQELQSQQLAQQALAQFQAAMEDKVAAVVTRVVDLTRLSEAKAERHKVETDAKLGELLRLLETRSADVTRTEGRQAPTSPDLPHTFAAALATIVTTQQQIAQVLKPSQVDQVEETRRAQRAQLEAHFGTPCLVVETSLAVHNTAVLRLPTRRDGAIRDVLGPLADAALEAFGIKSWAAKVPLKNETAAAMLYLQLAEKVLSTAAPESFFMIAHFFVVILKEKATYEGALNLVGHSDTLRALMLANFKDAKQWSLDHDGHGLLKNDAVDYEAAQLVARAFQIIAMKTAGTEKILLDRTFPKPTKDELQLVPPTSLLGKPINWVSPSSL